MVRSLVQGQDLSLNLPENLILLTNELVYWSLENKKWSVQASLSVSITLNPADHIWFPSSIL